MTSRRELLKALAATPLAPVASHIDSIRTLDASARDSVIVIKCRERLPSRAYERLRFAFEELDIGPVVVIEGDIDIDVISRGRARD